METGHCLFVMPRPVLDAVEFWQDEKIQAIQWMFTGKADINDELSKMMATREQLLEKNLHVNAILAGKPGCKGCAKLTWLLIKLDGNRRELEDG